MAFHKWTVAIWGARKRIQLTWALLKDEEVPLWQKAIPFLPLVYILSPFNIFTWAIPGLGHIDDVLLILLGMDVLERVVDPKIKAKYQYELVSGAEE